MWNKFINMITIIERNYKSIQKRGLITSKTNHVDFHDKLVEEVKEVKQELCKNPISIEKLSFEIADVILTALNYAKHYNIDIEKVMIEKIKINENR